MTDTDIQSLADDAQVALTGAQLKSLRTGLIAEAASRALEQIRDEQMRSGTPDTLKGLGDGTPAAPYFFLKNAPYNPYEGFTDSFKGLGFARYARTKAAATLMQRPLPDVAGEWKKSVGGGFGEHVTKALNESTVQGGGALVQTMYGEFIQLLRADAIVRASGARIISLAKGNLTMTRQTGGGVAYYQGENTLVTPSQQTFGTETMTAKKLIALTPVSNDLLRDAGPEADVLVRDDLRLVSALRSDLAFIRSDGTANTPKGIRYWTNPANIFSSSGSTLNNVTADLSKARRLIRAANVPVSSLAWYMSPRTESALRAMRDGNGNLVWKPEMDQGRLDGAPYYVTTQIPENLGGGSDTELYLVSTNQIIIGDTMDIEVNSFLGGTYFDGSALVSGISQDQTVIQCISRHDFFQRHDRACVVITGVQWQ